MRRIEKRKKMRRRRGEEGDFGEWEGSSGREDHYNTATFSIKFSE